MRTANHGRRDAPLRRASFPAPLTLLLGTILLAAGCGDGIGGPYTEMNWGPASNSLFKPSSTDTSGVVGDWFPCKDTGCTLLDDDGFRFTQDGHWFNLEAPGSGLEAGEQYCVEQRSSQRGTYTLSGSTLILQSEVSKGVQRLTFELQGADTAMVTVMIGDQVAKAPMRRISPPRSSGPCQDDQPPPMPMP